MIRWIVIFSLLGLLIPAFAWSAPVAPGAPEVEPDLLIPAHGPGQPSKVANLEQILAQNPDLDPLAGSTTLLDAADIVLFWNGPTPTDPTRRDNVAYHTFYDASGPLLPVTSPLSGTLGANWAITPTQALSRNVGPDVGGFQTSPMDVVTLNLNGDRRSDVVGAWPDPDDRVILFTPQLRGGDQAFSWEQSFTAAAEVPLSRRSDDLRLAAGDFDGDRTDEVALVYQGDAGRLQIEIFDGDGSHRLRRSAGTSVVAPATGDSALLNFDLAAGDFDGDGSAELALIAVAENVNGSGFWGIYLQLFKLTNGTLQPRAMTFIVGPEVVATLAANARPGQLALVAGNFDADVAAEIAFGYGINQPGVIESFAGIFDVRADLAAVTERDRQRIDQNSSDLRTIATGDMNLDGIDELVFYTSNAFWLYRIDDQGKLARILSDVGSINTQRGSSRRPVALADLNRDLRAEIIVANYVGSSQRQQTQISIYGADLDAGGNISAVNERLTISGAPIDKPCCSTNYALAVGDFDGDSVRLGSPIYRRETDVGQVLAIINAPPSHLDTLPDGTEISVNVCENPNIPDQCATSVYYETTTSTSEIAVDIQRSWTLGRNSSEDVQGPSVIDEVISEIKRINAGLTPPSDPSIEDLIRYIEQNVINLNGPELVTRLIDLLNSGNNVLGSHVATSIERSYGTNFEKATTSIDTVRIRQSILAGRDDVIIRTESDYDTWEYPIYTDESDTLAGHLLVVWPACDNNRCAISAETIVPGRRLASGYIPSHEPLNLLSYPRDAPPNYRLYNRIAQFRRVSVGEQVSEFEVTLSKIREDKGSDSRTQNVVNGREVQQGGAEGSIEVSAGVDFGFFQIGGSASSDYKRPYFVQRYSDEYGSERISNHEFRLQEDTVLRIRIGALTGQAVRFPYRVEPFVYWSSGFNAFVIDYAAEPIVEPGNGWDQYYNRPDPAFNLPWRRGDQGEGLRHYSREIAIFPALPDPGEQASLQARIHNYGLQDQTQPFSVAFYLADNGATTPTQPPGSGHLIGRAQLSGIPARSSAIATVPWTTPGASGVYTVYAVIETGVAQLAQVRVDNDAAYGLIAIGETVFTTPTSRLYLPLVWR
jgi:hypothetical protein